MDAFDLFGNVKAQKAKGMRSGSWESLFHSITKTLRILELCASLLLLYWILTRLSFALQISGDYFRRLSAFIGSPHFVFIISNAIIAALVANSRRLIDQNSDDGHNVESELYREISKKTEDPPAPTKSPSPPSASEIDTDQTPRVAEEVLYQDKKIISDVDTTKNTHSIAEPESEFPVVYRRSRSERSGGKVSRQRLRRSETEKYGGESSENPREFLYPQDKLSNEEFQRTIEAFIARQMRFLREESLAIVVKKQS